MPHNDKRSLRDRASDIKQSITGTLGNVLGNETDDNLGADRGTMDQLEARRERARVEARREAMQEQRQQEIEQARQEGRQEVLADNSDSDGLLSRAVTAVENFEAGDSDAEAGLGGGFGGGLSEEELQQQLGGSNPGLAADKQGSQTGLNTTDEQTEKEQLEAMGFDLEDNN